MAAALKVLFAGGGTGGHVYPAIALADALGAHADAVFVGTAGRLESDLVPAAGYPLHLVASRPLARKAPVALAGTLGANAAGTLESLRLISALRPDIVIATGGYVCFPVVLAARILRATGRFRGKIALLEPNAKPGLTNRLLAPMVDEIWGAFPRTDPRFRGKYVRTGVPVRAALRTLPQRTGAIERLGLSPADHTLLALGGSQGARTINDALVALVSQARFPPGWQLVLVTGESDYARVNAALGTENARVAVFPYVPDPSDAYACADLVLARAGASTLGELAAIGLPAILVPYPYASDDHQAANAEAVRSRGAAVTVTDAQVAAGSLAAVLAEATAPARLSAMAQAASDGRAGDAVASILARIDALTARKS
ncbi:MAG: undecaprenyldiphospho-muramoylpentapeptide beta-N-acetylglucosaminyltransferase [Vulcanimicrobiaceae bacterium]